MLLSYIIIMYIHNDTHVLTVAGDVMAGEEVAAEDGGGWDVGDELELPTDLVNYKYTLYHMF